MNNITELKPLPQSQKSFYGKAFVEKQERDGVFNNNDMRDVYLLYSYGKLIARYNLFSGLMLEGNIIASDLSKTTLNHITAYLGVRIKKALLVKLIERNRLDEWLSFPQLVKIAKYYKIYNAVTFLDFNRPNILFEK